MKTSRESCLCSPSYISLSLLLFLLPSPLLAINPDIPLLLSFKYSILSDPLSVLSDWGYFDTSPCSWNGVVCMGFPLISTARTNITTNTSSISDTTGSSNSSSSWVPTFSRVIGLVLPNSRLLGPIAPELGLIKHLHHLDLSGNLFNGTLPKTLFNATELRVLSLSNNEISGEVPQSVGHLTNLQVLNLAGNALTGLLPTNITLLPNLTTLSLSNNYLHGDLPASGFGSLETLDLSSNILNGTLPANFGGENLKYLNLSDNHLTGKIPPELGTTIPQNATVDLSFNNFTGSIPQTGTFIAQKPTAFVGNPDLCGPPLTNLCTIPSTLSNPPNSTDSTDSKSPPAIAAMPNNTSGDSAINGGQAGKQGNNRMVTILAIAAGDLAGIAVLSIVIMYVYYVRKNKQQEREQRESTAVKKIDTNVNGEVSDKQGLSGSGLACCLRKKSRDGDGDETDETSESSEAGTPKDNSALQHMKKFKSKEEKNNPQPVLVTIDGTPELELESLLKASAYIMGAVGHNIVYKAVLADGTALAVRRIGDNGKNNGGDKLKDFEMQVRAIARIRHPNVLRIRGFYWGPEEKLLIHDYALNGSLANISSRRRQGSSPLHMNWNTRMRIAKGIARGLSYIHEKKQVHGNIKPNNILLGFEFEPLIGDFGIERLIKPDPENRQFGSKRSALSLPELSPSLPMSPFAGPSSLLGTIAPYQAPETLKNLKPSYKSDVYSFGVVLLELISGRLFSDVELCQLNSVSEEADQVLRMVDAGLRGEVRGKEEAVLSFFKLGFSCCAMLPQKRPSMKDAMQALDRIPYDS